MTNESAGEDSEETEKRIMLELMVCVLETPVGRRDHHRRMREQEKTSQDYI